MEINFEEIPFRTLQGDKVYIWEKDNENEWQLKNMQCNICHALLGWKYGLEKFCPNCGVEFINTLNPQPPEEETDLITEKIEEKKE